MQNWYVFDWVPSNGGYRLWPYQPTSKDPIPNPAVQEGHWGSIQGGHELIRVRDYMLDWVPATGDYRLWRFDPESKDPLPGSPVQEGTWNSIPSVSTWLRHLVASNLVSL